MTTQPELTTQQIKHLTQLTLEHQKLEQQLTKALQVKDFHQYRTLSATKHQITVLVRYFQQYQQLEEKIQEWHQITMDDPALRQAANSELSNLQAQKATLVRVICKALQPSKKIDQAFKKNIIMEIHGAIGGEEGNLFAGDLYRMYLRYAERQNWKIQVINSYLSENGGFTSIVFKIIGKNIYSQLRYESGAHRVQRIPKTENKGRIHTSIATVAVLPEPDPVQVEIKTQDLRIDTYRASGAGGQHVNKSDSAVRITHLPTGLVSSSQDARSQNENKALALDHLRSKIYTRFKEEADAKHNALRKNSLGQGTRSEKIRTYNFPQNRMTDHRLQRSWKNLTHIMDGQLAEVITALNSHVWE